MIQHQPTRRTPAKTTLAALGLISVAALTLGACGSSANATAPKPSASASASTGGGSANGGANGANRAVSGLIADVTGSTAQVQGATSQTAVSWTDSTTFTAQVPATAADLTVGACVVARAAQPAAATANGATSSASPTSVAAETIQITPATNGSCAPARGAGPGAQGAGGTSASPGPQPSRSGGGSGAGNRRGGMGAFGQIASVGDGTLTVTMVANPNASGQTSPQGATQTVTWTSATTITKQAAATAAGVVVGQCMSATGAHDSTGAVTATSIRLSAPVNGSCNTGFVGRGNRPGGVGSTATPSASSNG